jgi:predicted dehydrogenase
VAVRIRIPSTTLDPAELCASEHLDDFTICIPNQSLSRHALLALNHDTLLSGEKPLSSDSQRSPKTPLRRRE